MDHFELVSEYAPTGGLTTNTIRAPIAAIPKNGYKSIGFVPSSAFGSFSRIFFKPSMISPAAKPAISAPKKPEDTQPASSAAIVIPLFARRPPTIPGINAGLSASAMAIYPARIGNIIRLVFQAFRRHICVGNPCGTCSNCQYPVSLFRLILRLFFFSVLFRKFLSLRLINVCQKFCYIRCIQQICPKFVIH